ncbi:MAG TPA: hypothetical protein VI932_00435 [Bacteroidota bacterium]|nr:hypothetical protein [Bacteroidota bacterium]
MFSQQDSTSVDSLLLKQLEQQLHPIPQTPEQSAVSRTAPSLNPDISAIGDIRLLYRSIGRRKIHAYLNEVELQVASVVDPYARAEFLFSFGKDLGTGELSPELEVGTLTSTFLPCNLQLTLGKFKPRVGKVNILHPHYFSFIEFPKVINNFFESEGMFMEGASLSWLIPNPYDFYQELVLEVGRAGSEPNASIVPGDDDQLLYVGHLKNFFDLSENATLEFGLTGLVGPNRYGFSTAIGGIDVTYKWKPLQYNTYKSFTWQTELLLSRARQSENEILRTYGGYSYIEHQFEKLWFAGIRYDYSGFPDISGQRDQAGTLLLRFQPTEYQIIALQYQFTERNYDSNDSQLALRFIYGIGKHGAHSY